MSPAATWQAAVDASIKDLVRFLGGASPADERSATGREIREAVDMIPSAAREVLAAASADGLIVANEDAEPLWMLTPKGRKMAYGFTAKTWEEAVADGTFGQSLARSGADLDARLSPMPPAVAEELAAWKEGRREQPWTEAHRREAFVRLCELAIEEVRSGAHVTAAAIAGCASVERLGSEQTYRSALMAAGYSALRRREAEVVIVRQRVERPAPTLSSVSDAELRREIAVDIGSLYDNHDLVTGACLRALTKYRLELADISIFDALLARSTPGASATMGTENDASRSLLVDMRHIATGKIDHVYTGSCPDGSADSLVTDRADGCPACDVLRRADALLDGTEEPAAPPSWTRAALERLMADPDHRARFNALRLSPEAANLIAACRRRDGSGLEELKACLLAWKDDVDRKAPPLRRMPAELDEGAAPWTSPPGTTATVLHGSLDGPFLVALVTLESGAEWPREVHAEHDETVVALSGDFAAVLCADHRSEEDEELEPYVPIGPGRWHLIHNTSTTEPATYISILRRISPVAKRGMGGLQFDELGVEE